MHRLMIDWKNTFSDSSKVLTRKGKSFASHFMVATTFSLLISLKHNIIQNPNPQHWELWYLTKDAIVSLYGMAIKDFTREYVRDKIFFFFWTEAPLSSWWEIELVKMA